MLDGWCAEEGLSWEFAPWTTPATAHHVSSTDEKTNPWWGLFKRACATAGLQIEPEIFPAGTDSRFLRALGIPAFGFSPLANSPVLLHEHNEYVDKKVFLDGIKASRQHRAPPAYPLMVALSVQAPRSRRERGRRRRASRMPRSNRARRRMLHGSFLKRAALRQPHALRAACPHQSSRAPARCTRKSSRRFATLPHSGPTA